MTPFEELESSVRLFDFEIKDLRFRLVVCLSVDFTADGVASCGGGKTSPRPSPIVQIIFF